MCYKKWLLLMVKMNGFSDWNESVVEDLSGTMDSFHRNFFSILSVKNIHIFIIHLDLSAGINVEYDCRFLCLGLQQVFSVG
jgi:hypothetical protein